MPYQKTGVFFKLGYLTTPIVSRLNGVHGRISNECGAVGRMRTDGGGKPKRRAQNWEKAGL
jgi:hypothetical protein